MTLIPTPQELGLPPKYQVWRKHQERAILTIDEAKTPAVALMLPPGAGKTGIYIAWAVWRKKRVMLLAPTKHLQDQIYEDFKGLGIMDLRGQSNYTCTITEGTVADAPCHGGYVCPIKSSCEYFVKLKRATTERFVLSNPSFWLHNKHILGEFDALIVDEAHQIFDQIARFKSVTFGKKDVKEYFHRPPQRDWKPWASYQRSIMRDQLQALKNLRVKTDETWETTRVIKRFYDKLSDLHDADPRTLIYQESKNGWTWDCVWPGAYRNLLTSNAKKYVFTSGTMTRRTMGMLGYTKDDYTWSEFPSTFPVARCPIFILDAPSLNFHTGKSEMRLWQEVMDRYLDGRMQWRGLVHSGSYVRAGYIAVNSRHAGRVITHTNSAGLGEATERYLASENGILVSPAITEGVDFPYDAARFQYIAKLPFVNPGDPVEAERNRQDPHYGAYTVSNKVMQMRGRVMRIEDDYGETAIGDGAWSWFFPRSRHHFTSYFCDAIVHLNVVPPPSILLASKMQQTPVDTAPKQIQPPPKKTLDRRVRVSASSAAPPLFAENPKPLRRK